ncbi:MAG TPA: DMT family transporter [Candidatus Dormibacteraeota bacterium]|nr:DMT family transporter [Candidatus Dormibacteraeota bacterium]
MLFAAMCVIWGIPYFLIRVAVGELSPVTLVFLRTGAGALILLPIVFARGGLGPLRGKWLALVVFATVEVAIPWLALSSAEQHISSALAGLLVSAVPLIGVVIATSLGNREHLRAASLSGLGLGVLGVSLIVGFDLRASNALALGEMVVVVVGYSFGPVILSRYLTGVPSVTVIGAALALCAIVYAPAAAVQWPHSAPSLNVIGAVAVLAVLCTAIGFVLFFALIAEVGPVRSTVITYINPAVAAVVGVAVLGESLTLGMGLGFVLVLAGSVLATRQSQPVAGAGASSGSTATSSSGFEAERV